HPPARTQTLCPYTTLFRSPDGKGDLAEKVRGLADRYGISSNDIKNLTVSAALIKLQQAASSAENVEDTSFINSLFGMAKNLGISDRKSTRLNSSHVKISYA